MLTPGTLKFSFNLEIDDKFTRNILCQYFILIKCIEYFVLSWPKSSFVFFP